jgi:hypothetical protein
MPLDTVIIVCGIVAAFLVFGVTLAWAERCTRNIVRPGEHVVTNPPAETTTLVAANLRDAA